jgi:hypothetical protein
MTPQELLFPWQGTISRLELGKRWWHRLAVVVFFTVLIATLLYTWNLMMLGMGVFNTAVDRFATARCWYVDGSGAKVDLGPAGADDQWVAIRVGESPVHVEIVMPDGELKDFVGKSPKEIKTAWVAAAHRQNVRRWLLSPVVAILVTLAMSYLLQSLYRILLYVVYGSQKRVAP